MTTKVLHSLKLLIPGGVERTRVSLFVHLPPGKYRHRVICTEVLDSDYALRVETHVEGLDALGEVRSVLAPRRYLKAARIIAEWRPDIIHGAIIEGYTLAAIAGRLKRVPIIIMEETSDPENRRWKGHQLTRSMAALSHHCIAVSPGVGRYLTERLSIPEHKVTVINNGVEQPAAPDTTTLNTLRDQLRITSDQLVIGSVGRMHDETHKRFGDLIQAFATLTDVPNARLILIGDGPERADLERLTTQLGLNDRVTFTGFQPDVGPYYALMHIFALASQREAFGLVNAEAMRMNLPVVATNVGGIPDVVDHERTGILVPPREPNALADALRRLLNDPELRNRMGTAGKQRADEHFSAERYAHDVHQLYQRLLAERQR